MCRAVEPFTIRWIAKARLLDASIYHADIYCSETHVTRSFMSRAVEPFTIRWIATARLLAASIYQTFRWHCERYVTRSFMSRAVELFTAGWIAEGRYLSTRQLAAKRTNCLIRDLVVPDTIVLYADETKSSLFYYFINVI